ncbi:hypothetical protein V6N13_090671 [Hibiscus sabdariffa]
MVNPEYSSSAMKASLKWFDVDYMMSTTGTRFQSWDLAAWGLVELTMIMFLNMLAYPLSSMHLIEESRMLLGSNRYVPDPIMVPEARTFIFSKV